MYLWMRQIHNKMLNEHNRARGLPRVDLNFSGFMDDLQVSCSGWSYRMGRAELASETRDTGRRGIGGE